MGGNCSTEKNTVFPMKGPPEKLKSDRGAALLLSLWALFLLSAMVIAWALSINSRLVISSTANRVLAAEAMAASGADVALCREITPSSPNLHRQMGDRESYDVQITGECGRLNLNFLTQGEDPNKLRILRQYLNLKGIDLNDLDVMMDSLLDWVSQNRGLHHLNACPETDDYHPPHAGQLFSVDELKKVCGWEEFTSKPGWEQDFTVVGNCGPIDLAWASRDVLRALPGLGDDAVDRFLQLRRGPDGIDGTADDFQFVATAGTSVPPEAQAALGLNQQQFQQIQALVQYKGPVMHIVSVGKSGEVTRSIEMVVLKQVVSGGAPAGSTTVLGIGRPQVFSWKEL
jgi:type II secretory pathway component PulK